MRIHSKTPRVERLSAASVARPEAEPVEVSRFDPRTDLNAQWYEDVNHALTIWEDGRPIDEFGFYFIAELFSYAVFDSMVRDRLRALPKLREWVVDFLNTQRDAWYQTLQGTQMPNVRPWPDIANVIQVIPEVRKLVSSWQVVNQLQLSDIWLRLSAFETLNGRRETLATLRSLMQAWPDLQPTIRTELANGIEEASLLAELLTNEEAGDWQAYGALAEEIMLVFPDQQQHLREKLRGHLDPLLAQTRQLFPDRTNFRLVERNAVLGAKKAWIDEQGLLRLEYPAQTLARSVSMPDRLHT